MKNTVSQDAICCAHCGHIERSFIDHNNLMAFNHKDECDAMSDLLAHDMFMALANAMVHMKSNDCLLKRAEENITNAMLPFAEMHLNENSFSLQWLNKDMTIKNNKGK